MAVALFGAVVTTILSAQAGLVAGNRTAANMSQAIEIGRCRMSELEEKQLKLGFPEIEEKDSSQLCCDDKEIAGLHLRLAGRARPLAAAADARRRRGADSVLGGGLGLDAGAHRAAIASGMATSLAEPDGHGDGQPAGRRAARPRRGPAEHRAVAPAVLRRRRGVRACSRSSSRLVYPSLKPLLETAIRRVTVVVKWKEGPNDRDFTLVQYITNPSRAGLLAEHGRRGRLRATGDGGVPERRRRGHGGRRRRRSRASAGASLMRGHRLAIARARGMTMIEVMVAIGDPRDGRGPHPRRHRLALARQEGRGRCAPSARTRGARRCSASSAICRPRTCRMHVPSVPALHDRAHGVRRARARALTTASTSPRSRTCAPSATRTSPTRPRSATSSCKDPDVSDKMDLVRREQTPIDFEPLQGRHRQRRGRGRRGVRRPVPRSDDGAVGRDVGLDADRPGSRTACRSRSRSPSCSRASAAAPPYSYTTKVFIPIQQPLTFGIPRQ